MGKDDKALIRFDFIEPTYLFAVGVMLLGAFVSLGSDVGVEAPTVVVGLVLALNLSVGLAALRVAVIGLSRWRATARWPDPVLLAAAGLVASGALAPISFTIDQLLLARGIANDDEPVSSLMQWPASVFAEWAEVVGPVLIVSLLLGLPAWWARRRTGARSVDTFPVGTPEVVVAPPVEVAQAESQESAPLPPQSPEAPSVAPASSEGSCLQRLPPALGTDLIAARAELQYVRIYTTRGDALVLGALKDIAEQRESEGQLVHRGWWICNRHVRTLRRRGTRYVLTLANGLEVPVSRRRQQALVKEFGSSATLN